MKPESRDDDLHPADRWLKFYPANLPLRRSWLLPSKAQRGLMAPPEIALTASEYSLGLKVRDIIWQTRSFKEVLELMHEAGIAVKPHMRRDKKTKELSFISLSFKEGLTSVASSQIGVRFDPASKHPRNPGSDDMPEILRLRAQALEAEKLRRRAADEVTAAIHEAYETYETSGEVILALRQRGFVLSPSIKEFYGESHPVGRPDLLIEYEGQIFRASETQTPLIHYRRSPRAYDPVRDAMYLTVDLEDQIASPM